jgi:hypothetical protein
MFYPDNSRLVNYAYILPAIVLSYIVRSKWSTLNWGLPVLYAAEIASYISLISLFDFLRGDLSAWIPTGKKRAKGSQYTRFILLVRWVPIIGIALTLAGMYKNWQLINAYAWVPSLSFWVLKFWFSRKILSQEENETAVDLIVQSVQEYNQEEEVKSFYSQLSKSNNQ